MDNGAYKQALSLDAPVIGALEISVGVMAWLSLFRKDGNRRLNQLTDEVLKRRLLNLPYDVAREFAGVKNPTVPQAHEMQRALMLGIFLALPARVANLTALDLDRHFSRPATKGGRWVVHIPGP